MAEDKKLLKKFNLTNKMFGKNDIASHSSLVNMMSDPAYLRQSSALINDALQRGFDVLQLANGDIVTTGTKTIVYQYTWNTEKEKLVRAKVNDTIKKKRTSLLEEEHDEDEEV